MERKIHSDVWAQERGYGLANSNRIRKNRENRIKTRIKMTRRQGMVLLQLSTVGKTTTTQA